MYIKMKYSGYDRSGQQRASGLFLLLVQTRESNEMRAIVRKVVLSQFGHFMMGTVRIAGESVTVSGAYGSDGLPCTVTQKVFDKAIPVPAYLIELWNNGGGWNSAGNEAESMHAWALENLKALYK